MHAQSCETVQLKVLQDKTFKTWVAETKLEQFPVTPGAEQI